MDRRTDCKYEVLDKNMYMTNKMNHTLLHIQLDMQNDGCWNIEQYQQQLKLTSAAHFESDVGGQHQQLTV